MLDSETYRKDLFKIAVITSVSWGIVSSFPLAVLRHPFPRQNRQEFKRLEQLPRNLPDPPRPNPVLSFGGITILMLSLWAVNIFLRTWLQRPTVSEKSGI